MTPASTAAIAPSMNCHLVVAAATALLEQCRQITAILPVTVYASDSRTLAGGTIGKHLRHVLDHFQAIVAAADSGEVVDYDRRERNVPMESRPEVAVEQLGLMLARLATFRSAEADLPLRIRIMVSADGGQVDVASTFARELAFATHHAVHHQAMIAAIAREFGVSVDKAFGKAPSTVAHEAGAAR